MPKLIVFDLDNTLTESRAPIPAETAALLCDLLRETKVAVISGAAFWQFRKELIEPLRATAKELENLYILTTSGAELWRYGGGEWRRVYVEAFPKKDKERLRRGLMAVLGIDKAGLEPLIDDRDSGFTYSALGKDAPPDLKDPWDRDQKKRREIVERLAPLVPGVEMKIGGTTSIDFTNKGIDKAFGVRRIIELLKAPLGETVFVGDALFADGNDEPVKQLGIECVSTSGPRETREIIKSRFMKVPETIPHDAIKFEKPPIAFFCAEYGLDDNSLRFAGGLGVLAADFLYEARDMGLSVACMGLWYTKQNTEKYSLVTKGGKPMIIEIPFERKTIEARVRARKFGKVWLLLVQVDDDILAAPYSLDDYTWIKQDVLLGLGGARVLEILGVKPSVYHLNEGHAAFAAFELIAQAASKRKDKSVEKARKEMEDRIVATKHTILKAGSKAYQLDFMNYFGSYCEELGISAKDMFEMGTDSEVKAFSGTHFVLQAARKKSAVSVLHAKFEKDLHPKSELVPITNGVYADRWRSRQWLGKRSYKDIWKVKSDLRRELVEYANTTTGSSLSPDVCTVVWARRFAAYKRPEAIISDLERLKRITSGDKPLQVIMSGKVYLDEPSSTETLNKVIALSKHPEWKGKIAYLPDYSISVAHKLVQGADIWLNTPRRGKEACGTSGMKAGLNGALQMTVSDGWVGEVDWDGIGWILPEEDTEKTMYDLLENEVAPLFYDKKGEWIERIQKTQEMIEKDYTTERMLKDYLRKLY